MSNSSDSDQTVQAVRLPFKRVMDSTSKVQMDYICLQYPGYFRFAKWMERLAQGIADGVIEVPKDH
ncbi:arylsulfatase [Escherichia coli]